jgi:hypothetical protein
MEFGRLLEFGEAGNSIEGRIIKLVYDYLIIEFQEGDE